MGHMIQGCIGDLAIMNEINSLIKDSQMVVEELPQHYFLLYITDSLYDSIHKDAEQEYELEPFVYLSNSMKIFFENVSLSGDLVYIETDYFGGSGSQIAGMFHKGILDTVYFSVNSNINIRIPYPERLFEEPINKSLRAIGVIREENLDEFDTLNLSNCRHMPNNDI